MSSVITLTPYDAKRQPLPDLGEGATVVITASYYGSRANTLTACIEQVKPFTSATHDPVATGHGYTDTLYGVRTAAGYKVMFSAELKRRLVAYLISSPKAILTRSAGEIRGQS